ncbi:MAG: orotidine-5'-phosphate decarboxylase [Lachnospiraceae bacterium]|nr:orotidine-5'-phosphate decarboxylase [Lachnospiraceae bacterium]
MAKDVIIALDFPNRDKTLAFLDLFESEARKPYVKIGMELFYAEGPQIVRDIKARGHQIFLDLKLHDIPNTVKSAMKSLAGLDVDMVNVHAAGTKAMMQAGLEGLCEASGESRPLLIAVTQLTSTDETRMRAELLIDHPLENVVAHYAANTRDAGLDGIVCSPLEAGKVHETCGDDFLTITPGIRFATDSKGDQKRVTTPADARDLGSDYIVVGRSITGAADPVAAYRQALTDFLGETV